MNERDNINSIQDAMTVCFIIYFGLFIPFALTLIFSKIEELVVVLVVIGVFMVICNILYMSIARFRDRFWFKMLVIIVCIPIYPLVLILNWFVSNICKVLKRE